MEWADSLTWRSLLALQKDDPRIRAWLHHTHTVQWAYLYLWRRETPSFPDLAGFADLPALLAWARAYYAELSPFLATLDEPALAQTIEFPWAAELVEQFGHAAPTNYAESVLQIALHTTHHRAQVAARLRELGGEPPLIDFIAWIWQDRPGPEWGGAGA
jgi:uncharacterized damage-inducible protein DinB